MVAVVLMLAAMGCWIGSAIAGAVGDDDRRVRALGLLGSLCGAGGALLVLLGGPVATLGFPFWGARALVRIDALSAAFLLPLHLVAGLAVVYGHDYWPLASAKGSGRWVRFFFGLLTAALTLVFSARQGLLFLIAWELMAMAAMLLIGTEHERPEVLRGTWIYLVCTHTGTLVLVAMVVLLGQRLGGYSWLAPAAGSAPARDLAILLLGLLGFGLKAGVLPFHFWLPAAHAGAPSHVSAILSSVMLKTGVYGLLRISGLLPATPHLGGVVLALGAGTALFGVACALAQRDYKRLLAYSSVENLGIIFMGVGLGFLGRAAGNPWLAALGFGGAIMHVWNHTLFKSLLFFGAGAVLHATGSRDFEALGGLARTMPRTALAMLPAVLAVSALPPFNGFLSEWLLYRGFFGSFLHDGSWFGGMALFALSLTGGFAAVAFAKFYGFLFLGNPRSAAAEHAHDPGPGMLGPMAVLAGLCLAMSLGGALLLRPLDRVLAVLLPGSAPLLAAGLRQDLTVLAGLAALLLALAWAVRAWLGRCRESAPEPAPGTWDCGYAEPGLRMQYSAGSFSDGWAAALPGLRVRMRRIRELFPRAVTFHSDFRDPLGEGLVEPRTGLLAQRLLRFRRLQQGHLSMYLLYILITLVLVFLWMIARPRLLP
jgi:hydrogenase-4 component B